MDDGDLRERLNGRQHTAGPGFDLIASKLRRPPARPGTVLRTSIIDRLTREDSAPIVSVAAPSGYGKTTLLTQWLDHAGQAVAWVSVDETDNDPKALLTYVAAALDQLQPVGERVFEALSSPVSSVPGSVLPRLASAFWSITPPVILVLDDVHLLHSRECQSALSVLADHVPPGSRLVLAGRNEPPLRIARLRAEDRIVEIGPGDLSMSREEAAALLRAAQVTLGEDDIAVLHQRTEGWPAGLYLAALYLREGGPVGTAAVCFGGDDRLVSQYMESEFLARISRRHRVFLTRTAPLQRMCAPLCEAVLAEAGSASALAELARSNLLLVPLDRQGRWYRYHHLFRDMLLAELERTEPGLMPALRRRAAAWCLDNDQPEEALEYSIAAGDVDTAARVVSDLWLPVWRGRMATLYRWLRWLDDRGAIEANPMLAVLTAMIASQTGRAAEAEHWADAVDRWQYENASRSDDPVAEAWAAVLRALMCRNGIKQMRADADEAAQKLAAAGIVAAGAALCQGMARVLSGDLEDGDAYLEEAVAISGEIGSPETFGIALCERSLLAMARGDWHLAEALARQTGAAARRGRIDSPFVSALLARLALHRGDIAAARQELVSAQRLRHLLTYAFPCVAVQARIELAHVHLGVGETDGAATLMREIDEILERLPDLGTLSGAAAELRTLLTAEPAPGTSGTSSLTTAELRVLPMLATHLSFPEIGAEMFLSPNTVKSQAMSIYRKLGASSRNQAVTRSRELGLLEG